MKILLSMITLLVFTSVSAEVKNISSSQKKELDQTLKIFTMAEKMPELWPAILEDLKPYKDTSGKDTIVAYFEGRIKKDFAAYTKDFEATARKFQEKIYKENEKEITDHISAAKKVFADVNKDSTKKSWEHMAAVKSTLLQDATAILTANPELALLRKRVKSMNDLISFFKTGENMDMTDFENFTVSRSIIFADKNSQKIMALNEKAKIPLDIKRGIRDLNVMRLIFGKNALAVDEKLCACSTDHSKDMHEKNFFDHTSPVAGKKSPWDRARNFGTSASGENIAKGQRMAKDANRGWYHSPGHFKNMFSNKNRVGLGVFGKCWTQMLGN
jgi:hypothetical protein